MKSIAVPSRFACLKIEDEEFRPVSNKSPRRKQEKPAKKAATTGASNKKTNGQKQSQQSTSMATTSKKKAKGRKDDRQWEEWKKKDEEFIDDNFQQDMHSAIVLSKLEFENQKKNAAASVLVTQDGKMKKKKTKTMSLEQFRDDGNNLVMKEEIQKETDDEGNFFENIALNAKQQLNKENVEEKRRERSTNIEEVISLAQAQEKLEIEKAKNEKLQQELQEARKEIVQVKKRNTTLCSMLSQGEMKDKVDILSELERLRIHKDELTEEVGKLYELLEQERTTAKANLGGGGSSNLESHSAKHKEKHPKKKKK